MSGGTKIYIIPNVEMLKPHVEISFHTCAKGSFSFEERYYHIYIKGLLAAKFYLKAFVKVPNAHVKLLSGNTSTIHDINNLHFNKSEMAIPLYQKP